MPQEGSVAVEEGEAVSQDASARVSPDITVVVCTYNRYDVLGDAIVSLESQSAPAGQIEILIVDNSSDHAAQEEYWASHAVPANSRLLFDRVPGLSRARNTGLREAKGRIIAYIDDDAVATPRWCASLIEAFDELPDAGTIGGPVEPIWAGDAPAWLHKWQRGFLTIVDLGDHRRALQENEWLAGTNVAFRTAALAETGGFNEALGRIGLSLLSNEELAVANALKQRGYASYYEPGARVLHRVHGDRATQQWLRRRIAWQVISDLLSGTPKMQGDTCWKRLAEYQRPLPPEMRGVRGLFLNTQDPDVFYKQCEALEAVMYLALSDGRDPEAK
jgi:glycosyltransferase involved in cell wall biosynthesis